MITGRLIGIGVGPGDPELITIKAMKAIRSAPVIAYTSSKGRPSYARQIVAEHIAAAAKEIKITLPMHPSPEITQSAFDEGASRISAELEIGRNVAVLCEGDPMIFGSFGPVLERLQQQYPTEIIAGVSISMAAAAASLQPLLLDRESLSILPATLPEKELAIRLRTTDCAVIQKLGGHMEKLRLVLSDLNLAERALYIEHACDVGERVEPFTKLGDVDPPDFSTILVLKNR